MAIAPIPIPPEKRTHKVCNVCGSEDVFKDATAVWVPCMGEWILGEFTDDADYCTLCAGATTIIDGSPE